MLIALIIACVVLVMWVARLNTQIDELRKTSQYNLDVFNRKFSDIESDFKSDQEQIEHLLGRIHDLEKENRTRT